MKTFGKILIVLVLVGILNSGCGYQNTDGVTRKLLPVEFGIYTKAALAAGETEQRIGIGKNAVTAVANADTGFNEARARVGIAEAQNKINSVSFSGPQQSDANLTLSTSQKVQKAFEARKSD